MEKWVIICAATLRVTNKNFGLMKYIKYVNEFIEILETIDTIVVLLNLSYSTINQISASEKFLFICSKVFNDEIYTF